MTSISTTFDSPLGETVRSSLAASVRTDADVWQTLMRLTVAGVLLPHGGQHLFGVFGGYGFSGTLHWMTGALGLPAPLAAAAIVMEVIAPLALIAGIGSRAAALLLAIFMTTAASTHLQNGFFMNWAAALPAGHEGFEYHILFVALALTVVVRGGGAWSLDRFMQSRWSRTDR